MGKKKIVFLISMLLLIIYSFSIIPVSNSEQNTFTLVGFWPLVSNADDYSGNALNGKAIGVTYSNTGPEQLAGSALFSNNTLNGNQGINLPLSPRLTFSKSSSFIIKVWIKTFSSTSMMIFAQQKCTYGTIQVYLDNGKPYFRVEDVNNHNQILPSSVSNINDGQWHNITIIRDGINHLLTIEVDGIKNSMKDLSNSKLTDSVTSNSIGKRYICGTTDNFIGNIADLRIYADQNPISNSIINPDAYTNTITSNSKPNSLSLFEYAVIIITTFLGASGLGIFMYNKKKKHPTESDASINQSANETNNFHEPNQNQIQETQLCKNCGQIIYPDEHFCANCGKRL